MASTLLAAPRRRGVLIGIAVFLGFMALVVGVFVLAQSQRNFEIARWHTRLANAAAQTRDKVNDWLNESEAALGAVAVNPTVQIYMTEDANLGGQTAPPEMAAQRAFLANYVASLATRGPFAMPPQSGAGLAVLDSRRGTVASTPGFAPPRGQIDRLLSSLQGRKSGPFAVRHDGAVHMFFAIAITPLQGAPGAAPVGYVVGDRIFPDALLGTASPLAGDGGYQSLFALNGRGKPQLLATGTRPTPLNPVTAEVLAARHPGNLQHARGFAGDDGLHLGVPVENTAMVLVESVPASMALAGVDARIRSVVLALLLALLAVILGAIALWRHNAGLVASERAEAALAHADAMSKREALLRTVSDVLLQAIDVRDEGSREHSRKVARIARAAAEDLGATSDEADTIELAGAMMNVGKLFVPAALLNKNGPLTAEERRQFLEGNARWLGMMDAASFSLPLARLSKAAHDLMRTGVAVSDPKVARDAAILVAANVLVALTSPRAYRPAMEKSAAAQGLIDLGLNLPAGAVRAVVAALDRESAD